MSLHRRATQQQITLIIVVPKPSQVLYTPQCGLAIRNRGVEVMLLAVLVDAEAFKVDVSARSKLRLYGSGDEDWRFETEFAEAVFDDGEFYCDDAGHFDGTCGWVSGFVGRCDGSAHVGV